MLALAVKESYLSQTAIVKLVGDIGVRAASGNRLVAQEVKAALHRLKEIGYVVMPEGRGWGAVSRFADVIFAFAARSPQHAATLQRILISEFFPERGNPYHRYFRLARRGAGEELRALYFLDRLEELEDRYAENVRFGLPTPKLHFLTEVLDTERFARLSLPIRRAAVVAMFETCLGSLTPPLELLGYVSSEEESLLIDPETVRATAETFMMTGRLDLARDFALFLRENGPTREIPESLVEARAIEAGVDFLRGRNDEAIAGFEESLAIRKKATRKRKVCPGGFGGLFYIFALARRGRPEDLITAAQAGKWGAELDRSEFAMFFTFAGDLIACLAGKQGDLGQLVLDRHRSYCGGRPEALGVLMFVILARLTRAPANLLAEWVPVLERYSEEAAGSHYFALAFEYISLRDAIAEQQSDESRRIIEALRTRPGMKGYTPFSPALVPGAPWELGLIALEQLAAKHGAGGKAAPSPAKTTGARKEVIWIFSTYDENDFRSGYWSLEPVERSIAANGKVSKGRRIALKRLKESPEDLPHLTDQDKAICRTIRHERGDYYHRESYHLDSGRALLELSGHPLVFADAGATRPLTFRRARFRLETHELLNGHLEVRLEPALQTKQTVAAVQDSASSYVIYEINPAVKGLAGILGENSSMTIPSEAKERFFQAVSTFAADVDIAADGDSFSTVAAADSGLRQVDSDTTIRLRLLPEGEGLAVRMLVRPVEGGDAIFAPGVGKEIVFGVVKDERLQTRRPLGDERTAAEAIIAACPSLRDSRGELSDLWEWRFPNAHDCLALLRDLHPLREHGVILEWPKEEPFRLSGVASVTNTKLSLGSAGDWLTASGEVTINEDLVLTIRQLLDLVAEMPRGSEFVELGDGQFLALESDFRHYLEDVQSLAQSGKGDAVKLPPLAALVLEEFVEKTGTSLRSKTWREWIERFRLAEDHDPEVPATLQAELRTYQLEGYRWLSRLAKSGTGACLADDMGLGKTVQSLALLLERAPDGPALVVAPTSVAANWLEETLKFAPTLRASVFGSGDRQVQLAAAGPHDLIICTYGLLQREEAALAAVPWHTVILDEAQAIKNSATSRSQAARKLQADFRLVTTGTPVENRLSELHTLFRFILPGYLGSWNHFRKNFADPIERDRDPVVRDRLRRLIHPFLLRRLKSGVLRDLPSRTEINLSIELSEPEAAFYEALRSRAVEQLTNTGTAKKENDDPGKKAFQILAELTRLRRACCHPALVDPKVGKTIRSAKLAAFTETVEEILAGRHQVLVFSQFVDHLALIRAELDQKGIVYQYLDGSTTTKKRKAAVDAFQRGEGDVFLISLKAGGFGLNLTAADYVIHMDPWWNPATEDQASDRAHRIGQTRPVTIYRFITKGTIEEKIVSLHHQKRELAESLLSGTDDANVRLSPEDLLDLIRE